MVLHTLQQSNAQTTTPHKHPTFAEEAQQDLQSSYAERSKPLLKEADVLKARHNYWMLRRAQDVVLSFLALVVLSPLFLVICIVNLFTPECSVFFSHERRGRRGKPFTIYKFQTMKNNTPNCATGELENPEQYITKFGKFLRKTSLDELPQLWNILKGDMSFVGPRPLISSEMRAHRLRLEYGVYRFRPGLTGWAQINGRDSISLLRKMKLDKEYCDNWSLKLDLIILLRSVGAVVKQEGFHEGTYHRR